MGMGHILGSDTSAVAAVFMLGVLALLPLLCGLRSLQLWGREREV